MASGSSATLPEPAMQPLHAQPENWAHLFLTTYSILRACCMLLDEAQQLKNSNSDSTKVVKQIDAEARKTTVKRTSIPMTINGTSTNDYQ